MAQGTLLVFNEAKQNISSIMDLSTDTFNIMLINSIPTVADLTPDSSDYVEVTGGTSYTAGGIALVTTWAESGGVVTFDSSTTPTWVKDLSGPTDIRAALIYNTAAIAEDALAFIDLTTDGATPISLQTGDISVTFDAGGIFTVS